MRFISSTCSSREFQRTPNYTVIDSTRRLPYLWMTFSPGNLHNSKEAVGASVAPLALPSPTLAQNWITLDRFNSLIVGLPARPHSSKSAKENKQKNLNLSLGECADWWTQEVGRISVFTQVLTSLFFFLTAGNHLLGSSTLKLIPFHRTNRCGLATYEKLQNSYVYIKWAIED